LFVRELPVSASERSNHYGFDGVHAVFSLLKSDAGFRFENILGNLDAVVEAELLGYLFADFRIRVMEGGQAVHELHSRVAGFLHDFRVDLIGLQ
jgi:hypothetical protein